MSEHQPSLHHTETAQIAFLTSGRKRITSRGRPVAANPQCEQNISITCKNQRIRQQRHANWQKADVLREYFRASLVHLGGIARFLPGHERRSRYYCSSCGACENWEAEAPQIAAAAGKIVPFSEVQRDASRLGQMNPGGAGARTGPILRIGENQKGTRHVPPSESIKR